ncbi:hypothetical protein [Brachybacterium hainanense]|uniref:Halobacterial output domain-containing protein n=1 Tax=Brachybacterium hainanense TaxID=1541174 RepID=A0ABV6RCH8_9MICO
MPTTPHRSYPYPATTTIGQVPADFEAALVPVDADVQALFDRFDAAEHVSVVHDGDGTWSVVDGVGAPLPVHEIGDGVYQIGA